MTASTTRHLPRAERQDAIVARLKARSDSRNGRNWQTLFALTNKITAERLPTVETDPQLDGFRDASHRAVLRSEVKEGDLIELNGFVGRVARALTFDGRSTERPVYVALLEYVAGDLQMFSYFRASTNNGCDRGHLAHMQGNDLAPRALLYATAA